MSEAWEDAPPPAAIGLRAAAELLEIFGPGASAPGAGSAAALAGVLAANLISMVAALTRGKEEHGVAARRLDLIDAQVQSALKPSLLDAVQKDAEAIGRVIEIRRRRDRATDPGSKRELAGAASEHLKVATEIPLEICRACAELAELGLAAVDLGYRPARADAATAVSLALGGATGALCLVYQNLARLAPGEWVERVRRDAGELARSLPRLQADLFSRVIPAQTPAGEEP